MAELSSKDAVLKMLYPQPSDGSGPGYISALDMQVTCANLYDQISLVNDDFTNSEVWDPINGGLVRTDDTFDALISACVDDNGVLNPYPSVATLTQALYAALLTKYPSRYLVNAGDTITPTYPIHQYRATLVVNWPVASSQYLVTTGPTQNIPGAVPGSTTVWWNGINFQVAPPSGFPTTPGRFVGTPFAIAPNDFFISGLNSAMTGAQLYDAGLRGNSPLWTGGPQAFTVLDLDGRTTAYRWDPGTSTFSIV